MNCSFSLEAFLSAHDDVKYDTFESICKTIEEVYHDGASPKSSTGNRDSVRVVERKLIHLLSSLGIDITVFKRERTYRITQETAILFVYVLDYLGETYYKTEWKNIPEDELIQLRTCYIEALYSSEYNQDDVEQIVEKFEAKTNCPRLFSAMQLSEFTIEALKYLKDEWLENPQEDTKSNEESVEKKMIFDLVDAELESMGVTVCEKQNTDHTYLKSLENSNDVAIKLSKSQWDMIGQHIEYQYRYVWRPQLLRECLKMVKNYPQNLYENCDEWEV